MNPDKLKFLCSLQKKTDSDGQDYFIGELGNSQVLIFKQGESLGLYLGRQIKIDLPWKKQRATLPQAARSAAPLT
jgi:hypothetical protein